MRVQGLPVELPGWRLVDELKQPREGIANVEAPPTAVAHIKNCVQGLGFGIWDLGFRSFGVWDLGFGIWGLLRSGFKV